ncbi:MAG: hypothetical protein ACI97K_000591 [Glaciecola sp.]|jgi:hypothetical protein
MLYYNFTLQMLWYNILTMRIITAKSINFLMDHLL